jgi:Ca-activated chloride channel family protein
VLAYDQAIGTRGGRARYVYPLSLGADRATKIDSFELRVAASDARGPLGEAETPGYAAAIAADRGGLGVAFQAKAFTPASDFVLAFDAPAAESAAAPATVPAVHTEAAPGERFVAVRVPVEWPAGAAPPARVRRDRAVIVDVSHSQSKETLAGEIAIAEDVIAALDPDERFVLLACDSACAAFPEDGLTPASEASLEGARAWLRRRALGGSSDVAGALLAAARRLDPGGAGQIVMIGDGAPTAGELSAEAIAARVRPEVTARQIDLRLLGAGRTVDAVVLDGLARALGGAYERLGDGEPLARRVADLALALRAPLLRGATLTPTAGLRDVYPRELPSLRVGSELLVLARLEGDAGEVRLAGDLGGVAFAAARPVSAREASPIVPRLWAAARIAELEASADPAAATEVVALSKRHHVLSRRTSLLVLENDRMFAEFGIPRTQRAHKGDEAPPGLGDIGTIGHGSDAERFGMMGLLGGASSSAPVSPFAMQRSDDASSSISAPMTFGKGASATPSRSDSPPPVEPHGHLWGGDLGAGGLGLSGVGEGGAGMGAGFGRLSGSHRTRPPQVRMGATQVSGRLPPEVIQRIVRQQFGRFRLCYESGLRNNPDLTGRVSVRFVIGTDGNVLNTANGGSDLPDANVVSCVVRAFSGLAFPTPEGGVVTVTYPIQFSPASASSSPTVTPPSWHARHAFSLGPTATHQAGDDRWMTQGDDALDKLRAALAAEETSRQRHEALVRGLLARGRFADALTAARRFADLDPDLGRAREIYAGAAAAAGEATEARTALDAAVELSPASVDLHDRAARAFEAAGDEARACAHWRSIASLRPKDDGARYQAWRCRARLGEKDAALAEARALDKPGKQVAALIEKLAAGPAPAYDAAAATPGTFEATVRCTDESARCPSVVVVRPNGDVVSPWSPTARRTTARSVALLAGLEGTYRTLLVGGAPDARGEVVIRAHESARTFRFDHGGLQTVAATTVTGAAFGWHR